MDGRTRAQKLCRQHEVNFVVESRVGVAGSVLSDGVQIDVRDTQGALPVRTVRARVLPSRETYRVVAFRRRDRSIANRSRPSPRPAPRRVDPQPCRLSGGARLFPTWVPGPLNANRRGCSLLPARVPSTALRASRQVGLCPRGRAHGQVRTPQTTPQQSSGALWGDESLRETRGDSGVLSRGSPQEFTGFKTWALYFATRSCIGRPR